MTLNNIGGPAVVMETGMKHWLFHINQGDIKFVFFTLKYKKNIICDLS